MGQNSLKDDLMPNSVIQNYISSTDVLSCLNYVWQLLCKISSTPPTWQFVQPRLIPKHCQQFLPY